MSSERKSQVVRGEDALQLTFYEKQDSVQRLNQKMELRRVIESGFYL
jgi:hypothetical protein